MFARVLLSSVFVLSLAMPAMANQVYVQASAWTVNRLPVMPGQEPHGRCVVQSAFSGNASVQLIVENKKIRGAVFIVTEPIFKKEGRSIDVTLSTNNKAFEFPAKTLSKYALAVEISNAYQSDFEKAVTDTSMITLKSGFDTYNFSVAPPAGNINEALACTPIEQPKPVPVEQVAEPIMVSPKVVATLPDAPIAPLQEATKMTNQASGMPVVIGGQSQKNQAPKAFMVKEAGQDVPLSEALPKIVPSSYKFRFAQGASAGEKISWEAGQDWLETLVLALDDTDLQVAVNNNTVTVLPSLKAVAMPVGNALDTQRADVIVKEPTITDPSKPPSPGMMDEARAVLDQLRLKEGDLKEIVGGQVLQDGDDMVVMPEKPVIVNDDKMKPVMEDIDMPDNKVADNKATEKDIEIYRAKAGENMADVVARWAMQAGIDLDMNLQRDYKLARDITVQGDIDLAATQLLSQFKDIPSAPRVAGVGADVYEEDIAAPIEPAEAVSPVEQRLDVVSHWSAAKGTSLHAALVNWTRQGQMQLIWNGARDVQLPANLKSTTRMGNALEMLLSLYDGQAEQPQIQINRDPDTGLVAMIVNIEG